ncbi:phosphomannomutase [Corynebacterium falsenii DSM 44353]|uniref:phospho-sugar mutase n=1 Tax=Corynebacterium falsenii TaxID=108486 RepID=UPI0003E96EC6|nr:phospho-sugar mutase [Corynebacterium falsenii]AHI02451.1 phosphomannomutase [Corynebacterium falsenii DSM 44353]UBI05229.1 phospho-sugar mutase [Corynebacterium falsenii]UBI06793.1 phospho-sugar mutase [Corynebacterium falsenii]
MSAVSSDLIARAREWAEHDPDPATKQQVEQLIVADDAVGLGEAFHGPLSFGTAGLRAEIGPGESRMNRAVVIRATAGLVAWLKTKVDNPVVVVGCDARYGSAEFQRDAAQVIAGAGGTALVLPAQNPTPLTAFAVKQQGADAGIMVTASHNPPKDNGYKVYLGGRVATGPAEGVQLISPADKEIAEAIAAAPAADEVLMASKDTDHIRAIDPRDDYAARAVALAGERTEKDTEQNADVRIALTAMHGVGAALGERILTAAGFEVSLVPEQAQPDPDFPTVSFPNPEEPGALDLAKKHATEIGADVIIAYDPDADRCAVATPDDSAEGGWRQLTGDETGALLGDYLARRGATGVMANSVVSSRLLSRVAEHHGLEHQTTLTGFKWIARTPQLCFGYEEAIGYCCDPEAVADKDGVGTSVVLASLVADLKAESKTLDDALDDLARQHGLYQTAPLTFRVTDLSLISEGMDKLRAQPPESLAGSPVTEVKDLATDPLGIGATDGMLFVTADNDRVICRPSGTEPKLKCYLEVVLPVDGEGDHGAVPRDKATQRLAQMSAELKKFLGM